VVEVVVALARLDHVPAALTGPHLTTLGCALDRVDKHPTSLGCAGQPGLRAQMVDPALASISWPWTLIRPHSDPELSQEIPVLMLAFCVLVSQLWHSVFVEPLDQQAIDTSITDDARHDWLRDQVDAFAAQQSLTARHLRQQRLYRLKRQRKATEPPLDPRLHFGRSLSWLVTVHERKLRTSRNRKSRRIGRRNDVRPASSQSLARPEQPPSRQ